MLPIIVREEWTSRKVEQFVVDFKKNISDKEMSPARRITEQPYSAQLKRIADHLNTDVKIRTNSKGAGQITIKFKNEAEFERLENLLG